MGIQDFKLTNATMELLFNYLIDKPYKEVAELIIQIQKDVQISNEAKNVEEE